MLRKLLTAGLWVGRYAKVDVYLHWTWLILLACLIYYDLIYASLFVGVFFCVLLHEFGHALTAKWCGSTAKCIYLLPIGGVAMIDMSDYEPKKEFLTVIAGPFVNLLLALICFSIAYLIAGLHGLPAPGSELSWSSFLVGYCYLLAQINVFIMAFNLLPFFPLDGGRLTRAALTLFTGNYLYSTWWAVRTGQFFLFVMGVFGLCFGAWTWGLIAAFLIYAAEAELKCLRLVWGSV